VQFLSLGEFPDGLQQQCEVAHGLQGARVPRPQGGLNVLQDAPLQELRLGVLPIGEEEGLETCDGL